jgi:hypothetical protein
MLPLAVLSAVVFVFGVVVTLTNLKNWKRRQRILATPTSPIAQASGHGPVEIKGRVVPGEHGVIQAPFSGRHAVWTRITVQERRSSGRNSYWHTLLTEADGRVFLVDDGSGQYARVMPAGATVILDKHKVASSGTFNDAQPHVAAFLASRGLTSTSWLGFNKAMRYEEELIAPGDPLYALGPSRREPGPPVNDGYRMVPRSQLVLFAGIDTEEELILTNKSEEQLTSKLLGGFIVGLVLTGLGLLAGFVWIAAGVIDALAG